jgi:hypothetical protein
MLREDRIEVLQLYCDKFSGWGPAQADPNYNRAPSMSQMVKHARWMMVYMLEHPEMEEDKANRWFGFLQGMLWAAGLFSISELKEHNRK